MADEQAANAQQGEQQFALEPFGRDDAVELFVARARSVNHRFRAEEISLADMNGLVSLLDGLPLAIELAAARSRLFSPAVLQKRLREAFDRQADRYERLLAEAVGRGDLPALDTRCAAYAIIALHEGRIMLAKMNDDPELLGGLGDEVLRLIGAPSLHA